MWVSKDCIKAGTGYNFQGGPRRDRYRSHTTQCLLGEMAVKIETIGGVILAIAFAVLVGGAITHDLSLAMMSTPIALIARMLFRRARNHSNT